MENSFFKAYRQDKSKVETGVWVTDFEGGAAVRIRKPSSETAREARKKIESKEPYRLALQKAARKRESLPTSLNDALNREWVARGIIVDWKNVPNPNGEGMLPFSVENALLIFAEAPGFFDDILEAALSEDIFKNEEREENSGN